jgi:hypothetical protein
MVAFEEYKKLKPRSGPGQADDVDELYTAAKSKKAMIEASEAEKAAAPAEDPSNGAGQPTPSKGQDAPKDGTKPSAPAGSATPQEGDQ